MGHGEHGKDLCLFELTGTRALGDCPEKRPWLRGSQAVHDGTGIGNGFDRLLRDGDFAGGGSAINLLLDPAVDAGVFELARGGLLRGGMGIDRVDVGIVLNVLDNHLGLDGIETRADMAGVKGLVATHCSAMVVLNADDPAVAGLNRGISRVYYFSATRPLATGAWLNRDALKVRLANGREETFPLAHIRLQERHNLENIMAALLLALDAGADPQACREVLAAFRGLHHRLEWVADLEGVSFYDDSKGTNVGAVATSLAHFDRPVILIAGGRDKDSDFSLLNDLIAARVKALVLIGETRERLAQVWQGLAPTYLADGMAAAVARAWELSRPGEVVLLSPACASFDMYKDYAQRGRDFQNLVRELNHAD